MQELKQDEIDSVSGGIVWLAVAGVAGLGIALGIGIYNGYQKAQKEDQAK
jgi:lactobin A/cerein 7B family class IIb bacteriocin